MYVSVEHVITPTNRQKYSMTKMLLEFHPQSLRSRFRRTARDASNSKMKMLCETSKLPRSIKVYTL